MNFKKLFPDKKVSQKKVLDFFDKKGFYIVLVLCITVIGITAALITTHNITSRNFSDGDIISPEMASNISTESENMSLNLSLGQLEEPDIESAARAAAKTKTDKTDPSPAVQSPEPSEEPKKTDEQSGQKKTEADKEEKKTEPKKDNTSNGKSSDDKAKASSAANPPSFIKPVFGEITYDFANDKLVYSKTLDEWRTHSGIDIKADRGSPVKVVADGVVMDIKNDPRLGITIIVEHTGGIKTIYANLASSDMVTPNQKVKQGDVISSVGNTAKFEAAEPPHLHFEVLKDNKPVNPENYLSAASFNKNS